MKKHVNRLTALCKELIDVLISIIKDTVTNPFARVALIGALMALSQYLLA